ncbi:MAG: hypothetical protein K2J76_00290, partial [Oscillospiraceae bacterium]|nr:hypothetical protein [Oscillospiraceae bacterium]
HTLSMYYYNGEKTFWGHLFDDDAASGILESLAAVSAERAEDWSPADVSFPVYGVKLGMNDDGFEAAWSNGYWITRTGEAYRFEYDFAALWEDYDWEGAENQWSTAAILPCSYYFCRDENGWIADYLPPAGNLPAMPETLTAAVSKLDNDVLTVEFTNNGEEDWFFGEMFELQAQLDGEWYSVPTLPGDWVYHMLAYIVKPQQTLTHDYDLSIYGTLPEGNYRIVTEDFSAEFYLNASSELTAASCKDENGEWVAERLVPADIPTITKNVNLFVTAQDENSVTVRLYQEPAGDFKPLEFGNIFHVEVFVDGKWYIVPTKDMDFAFPLTMNVVPYDESRDITYDFFMYDPFPEGRYRVVNDDEFFFEFTAGETITPQNDLAKDIVRNVYISYFENGRVMKAYVGRNKDIAEILSIISANPAERAEDWSGRMVTSPMFGISATDVPGWAAEGVWSNGYWITQTGEGYRLDLDMDLLKKIIVQCTEKSESLEDIPIAWQPCGTYLCRDENGWIAEHMVHAYDFNYSAEFTENVTAEITEQTENSITLEYTNNGEKEWMYGEHYNLDVQLDGEWYDVPTQPGNWVFTDVGYILPAGETRLETYDFLMYGDLPAGRYRITANGFVFEFDKYEPVLETGLYHSDV